jgi:dihydrofolate reductase
VLSSTLTSALWPKTRLSSGKPDDVAALKRQSGKDIYLVGGARTHGEPHRCGLVDELRLIVLPLIAGQGKELFATSERHRELALRNVQQLEGGRLSLIYEMG